MSHSTRIFFTASFVVFSLLIAWAGPRPKASVIHVFNSRNTEGLIGTTEEFPSDNPGDNIFHVQIDQVICTEDNVWLEYELDGVEDHTSVARSINDHRAVGGHLVKKRRGWALQQERIDGTWLLPGDNVIRFTMPMGASHSYRVRNLKITVTANSGGNENIVINQPSKNYYNKTAYIKGFLPENNKENTQLKIGGKYVPVFKGEFESEVAMINSDCNVEVELIHSDGTTQCESLSYERMEGADFHFAINSAIFYVERFIRKSKTDSVSLQGANLKLVSGALTTSSFLSITALRDIDIPALDAGMVNVTATHSGYRFLPHGTQFQKEAELRIPFDPSQIPDGYTDKDIRTYFFDEQAHHWIALGSDTLIASTNEVVSRVSHFTDYIDAIIKVPESPETEAFNSTSIKGIKAANPALAVNLISPPQANNSGSASVSYPINIPTGRNGMQPQLGISYSSDGGNGWLGIGWNLAVPSIGIETRWGAPRFDLSKETETYVMDGEMLAPVAHRGILTDRSTGDKQFYPRIEGGFNKIIRHGSGPSNYWWEVTDKSGTRHFYGGSPETQFDKTATLRDDEAHGKGNIAHWALTETRDLKGNFVKYHYAKDSTTGLNNGNVLGYQLYINNITYTGHNGTEGQYNVIFSREQGRSDVTIAGNLGFKRVTADRLKKIQVQLGSGSSAKKIRSYVLDYKQGEFYKSLLAAISEYDAADNLFNTHTFDYYDEVSNKSGFAPLKQGTAWKVPGDGIRGDFKTSITGFTDEATSLSGTKSSDINIGVAVMVGTGADVITKSLSAGVTGGYSESESEGLLTMLDMNGDGLQDKVYSKGGLHYRPNLLSKTGEQGFGATPIPITGNGIGAFYREQSKTTSWGAEAIFVAMAGYSHNNSTSKVTTYFTDVNGDQLPDIVDNGVVYFNHLDPDSGAITYSSTSAGTPNGIFASGSISSDLLDLQKLQQERLLAMQKNPLLDIVRMWKAPFTGTVNVTAPVQLLQNTSAKRSQAPADGVKVSMQLERNVLWADSINASDYNVHTPTVNSLNVNEGDRLFFRVGSRDNGSYDSVRWNPLIEYVTPLNNMQDANGKKVFRFVASEDFTLSSLQAITPPFAGQVKIDGALNKPQTTDDIILLILRKKNNSTVTDTVWQKKFAWNMTATSLPDVPLSVTSDEQYYFKVFAGTNVDWTALSWKPHMIYTAASDPSVDISQAPIEVWPVVASSIYAHTRVLTQPFAVKLKSAKRDTLKISPSLTFLPNIGFDPNTYYNGAFTLSVKKLDTLVAKTPVFVLNGNVIGFNALNVPVKNGDQLYIELHTLNTYIADSLALPNVTFKINNRDTTIIAGLYTRFAHDSERRDAIYGALYRGWGQFGWNGNNGWESQPIDVDQLKVSDQARNQQPVNTNGLTGQDFESQGTYDATKDRFFVLLASGAQQRWISGDRYAFVLPDVISSSRLGDDDLSIVQVNTGSGKGDGAAGIDKISKSSGNAYTLGVSFGLSASKSHSDATSRTLTDFMDLNGDQYPDIVSEKNIQYTDATGGLSNKIVPAFGMVQRTNGTTDGFTATGSFPMTFPKFKKSNLGGSETQTDAGDAASTSGLSLSVSVGETTGDNHENYMWMDVNGDALPDIVDTGNGTVALNLGYKFAKAEPWQTFTEIQATGSSTETGGIGFNILQNSISGGFSVAKSKNFSNQVLMDVNGDGLPDRVSKGNPVQVWINTGNGFATLPLSWNGTSSVSENTTASESANVAFTIGFTLLAVKWTVTPSVSGGHAMARELSKFADMNGDGFPDLVSSNADGKMNVSLSTIGRTNLLKSVQRPLGASFTMTYNRMGNTYNLPHSVWVMDSVTVFDGFKGDGADKMLTTYSYENGFYDRHERENYGFATVTTKTHDTQNNNIVYATVTRTFLNTNYYNKGLQFSETMTDALGRKFSATTNFYHLKDITTGDEILPMKLTDDGKAFPALVKNIQDFFEGQPTANKTTSVQYEYDLLGNVVTYTDNGDVGPEDDLKATISYHNVDANYIKGAPKLIIVNNGNTLLRKRESIIDQSTGEVTQIKQYLDDKNIVAHDMQYDTYGNLTTSIHPPNGAGQRLTINYVYDPTLNMYPIQVTNSYGYSSSAQYDFRFGAKLNCTDMNGNKIIYNLDDVGRVTTVTGPYESGGGNSKNYTIKFEYHPEAQIPYALTNHFDPQNPKNDLQTSVFIDGLGRTLQTKKDISYFNGDGKADDEMMSVSGRLIFDSFGRTIQAFYPTVEAIGSPSTFNPAFDKPVLPTITTYDVLSRPLSVTLPDLSVTKMAYGFGNDRDGKLQFSTKATDANGKQTEHFTDVRGRATSVKNYTSGNPIWTSFKYNAVNEQIEATDDLSHTTFSYYDNLGRRIKRQHPDAGVTTYNYDFAGNLLQLVTANLANAGMAISYTYDFERVTQITYPQNPENNVKYTYGVVGDGDNRVGRVVLQEDATGAQEFFYGKLGEVVKNVRTIVIPQHAEQTFITQWTYDTWNRLTSMDYPDGETVTFNYNLGGLLHDMSGKKKSSSFAYVNQLGYDKFEQRVFLAYGNGTKTSYSYEPDRRRLKNMISQTAAQRAIMDNVYSYDKVNNILDLKNNAPIPAPNLMGGSSEYKYTYDDLYRLASANGNYKGANDEETYTLAMTYNSVGGILAKNQNHAKQGNTQKKTTYTNSYSYGDNQPHSPIHIGKQTYTYDANGNQLGWKDDVSGQRRNIVWDEENRIRAIEDNGAYFHYVYDASGDRVLKGRSSGQRIFTNGTLKGGHGQMGNYTVYVNPYVVLKSGGYTKHFYIEGQRILSKLGGGWDNNGQGPIKQAGNGKIDYNSKALQLSDGIVKNLKFLGADGQILTAGKSGKIPPGQVNGTGNVTEQFRYFYHPDHLRSTSYVTDASGEVFQHLEYFAFGETFVDEHSNTDRTPYLFNGKELDEETGLYYYGARYYDPKTSVWQSVDPMAEAASGLTPYRAFNNNPVYWIDPTGNLEFESYKSYKKYAKSNGLEVLPEGKIGSQGHWLTSDRKSGSSVWAEANKHNLGQANGASQYTNIEQRAAFYGWFQSATKDLKFETRWAGAASKVAQAINEMANPTLMGINVTYLADKEGYSSPEARDFANTGNRMIFEDVFPKLAALYKGPALKGQAASDWDAMALSQEQNLIQPLYESTPAFGLISASSKQLLFGSSTLAKMKDIGIAPFPRNGNLNNVGERWQYGMQNMGYNVTPSQMPNPGAGYTNGTMFKKFR